MTTFQEVNGTAVYSDLKGKVFVITGAASGMGRTTALMLAQQGAHVGLLDLRKPDAVLAEVEKLGGKGISIECNVQKADIVDAAVKEVAERFGRLDGAANMAGYVGHQGFFGKGYALDVLKDNDWDDMLATNLNGVKNCVRAELNNMKGHGSIVNAASIAGQYGPEFNAPYSVAKWGVIGLTKCLAREVGTRGIRANALAPGIIRTALADQLGNPDQVNEVLVKKTALKRIGEPEEVSRVILFLFSDQSAYISGSVINVDAAIEKGC
ncbi:hypothetical protein AYO20_00850 [Fonsecaea nubica]|uniref:Uncharacterized protein n=1 Tax=Fonsecaea nubica TaxID=856822 RepID=A0A178DE31_9EURO|nr:hypothetical protein AYO20_00850 [Fonsecaea nubica]OAL39937.1 hypothetical protein AYO20_00850 [Fonsecaea nubica]